MIDGFKEQGLRRKLVDGLYEKGIRNQHVLNAMLKVPRHFFMDSGFIGYAYKDQAFPIAAGQTISQPYTVAFQSSLLDIEMGDKVLEIGTGSGYQTAILLEVGAIVYSIERQKELYYQASQLLGKMAYNPHLFWGDGYQGKPGYAPFDKILITAGAPIIPDELLKQLRIGGVLVVPLGKGNMQVMTRIVKLSETEFSKEEHGDFSFVPFLEGRV